MTLGVRDGLRWQRRDARALTVVLVALPVWWVLGLAAAAPMAVCGWLGLSVLRQPERVRLLPGTAWWLLFLLWLGLGVAVLWVDAPLAETGGGMGRLLVFALRAAWYLAATAVLVWVANTSRSKVPDTLLWTAAGSLFVTATLGGWLGWRFPGLEFRSLVEYVLPGSLTSNEFVRALVHPEASDVQMVLGRPEARPKAPFAYSNTWGAVTALSLVFLVAAATRFGRRGRVVVGVVAVLATVPVVYSLNRGLWGCLALGGAGLVMLLLVRRRTRATWWALGAATLVAAVLALGPLGNLVQERMDNQHSNDRRGQLLGATVESMSEGSPVVGFGTTRNVQGSFASISGGSTPQCPACGVPPLGTQGHVWLVLFSQGWWGFAFFLAFVLTSLAQTWRCRTVNESVATFVVGFFLVQMWVYDTLGLPLVLVMLAIGMARRERLELDADRPARRHGALPWTLPQLADRIRRDAPVVLCLALVGAVLGWWAAPGRSNPEHLAQVRVLLVPPPTYVTTGLESGSGARTGRPVTIDTEASLVVSQRSLERALGSADTDALRGSIEISAEPNTDILVIGVRDTDPEEAAGRVVRVADSYLLARRDYLADRRAQLVDSLQTELSELSGTAAHHTASRSARAQVVNALNALRETPSEVGRVVRVGGARSTGSRLQVPVVSGLALGGLLGIAICSGARLLGRRPGRARTRSGRPRPRWRPPTALLTPRRGNA